RVPIGWLRAPGRAPRRRRRAVPPPGPGGPRGRPAAAPGLRPLGGRPPRLGDAGRATPARVGPGAPRSRAAAGSAGGARRLSIRSMTPKLDHVGIDVSDYDASKAFYEQAL